MSKIAHDPADGWTAITSETDWPDFGSPLPMKDFSDCVPGPKKYEYKCVVIKDSDITQDMINAGISVYRTYQDQVFPAVESVVREIYIAMQAAK